MKKTLLLLLSVMLSMTQALADDHTHNGITFTEIAEGTTLANVQTPAGNYYLGADITVGNKNVNWTIKNEGDKEDLNLCLNGKTLTRTSDYTGSTTTAVTLKIQTSTFNIYDEDGSGTIDGGSLFIAETAQGTIHNGTYKGGVTLVGTTRTTIEGGTYNGQVYVNGTASGAYPYLTINGGTFNDRVTTFSLANLTINGGTFKGKVEAATDYSKVTINNGYFDGEVTNVYSGSANGHITILGGYFKTRPNSSLVSSQCQIVETGDTDYPYVVVPNSGMTVAGNEVDGVYWASFYESTLNWKADDNTDVYAVDKDYDGIKTIEITDKIIVAGKPVIMRSSNATIQLTRVTEAGTPDLWPSPATLIGTDIGYSYNPTYSSPYEACYVLHNGSNGVGFYQLKGNGTIGAHKAYMVINTSAPAKEFYLLDNSLTGISTVKQSESQADEVIYDLQGRRITNPVKGLYIVNGKKVVIK